MSLGGGGAKLTEENVFDRFNSSGGFFDSLAMENVGMVSGTTYFMGQ